MVIVFLAGRRRPLGSHDIPNISIPYQDSSFTRSITNFPVGTNTTFTFTNADWGINNNFYFDQYTVQSRYEVGNFSNPQMGYSIQCSEIRQDASTRLLPSAVAISSHNVLWDRCNPSNLELHDRTYHFPYIRIPSSSTIEVFIENRIITTFQQFILSLNFSIHGVVVAQ